MSFIGVLETVGKDFARGLKWAVAYAPPVEKLVALLFPAAGPAIAVLTDATALIQNAVILVEQKFAAGGIQSGTGTQKLAELMILAGDAVAQMLGKAGVAATPEYIANLVSAVVAILNAQPMPAAASTK